MSEGNSNVMKYNKFAKEGSCECANVITQNKFPGSLSLETYESMKARKVTIEEVEDLFTRHYHTKGKRLPTAVNVNLTL